MSGSMLLVIGQSMMSLLLIIDVDFGVSLIVDCNMGAVYI
jgi:hypothetical protein